jgi:hypothetical protein
MIKHMGKYMKLYWIIFTLCITTVLQPLTAAPRQLGAGRPKITTTDAYTLRVTSYYQDKGRTVIILSDGSAWRLQTPTMWLVGDTVYLTSMPKGLWGLYNDHDHSTVQAEFVPLASTKTPRLQQLPDSSNTLTLNDGSQWHIDWWQRIWGRTWQWQKGDRILVSPLQLMQRGHTHLLINIDRSWHHLEADTIKPAY